VILILLYVALARSPDQLAPGPKTFKLVLQEGRLVSSPAVLDAMEGDTVTLSTVSNRAATLHVHEYEQQFVVPLVPGEQATATFTASRAGRFPVHVIGIDPEHPEVAAIQVRPR
jgi:plastocyanin